MTALSARDERLVGGRAKAAWIIAAIATAFGGIAAILLPAGDEPVFVLPLYTAIIACFAVVGGLVGTRRPRNPIGWLLLGTALTLGTSLAASSYVVVSAGSFGGALPGTLAAAWLSSWVFVPVLGFVLVMVPLLYPTGRLLSPRWRWVVRLVVIASIVRLVHDAFAPGELSGLEGVVNPFGIAAVGMLTPFVPLTDLVVLFVCFPLAILATVLRFRRGTAMERAQLKWFASAALFTTIFLGLSFFMPLPISDATWVLGMVAFAMIPVSIAVALLRYRLYEIDRIISRTIAWVLVSGILLGGFAVAIVALQALLEGFTQGPFAVAALTLIAAAAFQPLLRSTQTTVDHRFNRVRYDAQRTADAFGERLRGEVAIDAIATDLQATIGTAMRPATQGLWLRGLER